MSYKWGSGGHLWMPMYEHEHEWTVDGTHAIESLVGGWVLDLDLDELDRMSRDMRGESRGEQAMR